MKRIVFWTVLTGLVFASGYLGYRLYHYQQDEATRSPAEQSGNAMQPALGAQILGRPRPEFTLPDLDGRQRSITEWDGKVVALNFWATWCPPCLKEVPEFVSLQEKYRSRGLQFIGIALQKPEEVREFVVEHHVNYPILAGELEVIKLAEAYGNNIGALPYTVIIDRNGQIAHVKPGILPTEEAESIITGLL
ncbi:MAG: TlpA disulfide reductase family protein [Gammaproteobacteria bacterium]|nr:TlpA disulfide reductase family protein [Gammaproteobacteria bacterium]